MNVVCSIGLQGYVVYCTFDIIPSCSKLAFYQYTYISSHIKMPSGHEYI